MMLITGLGLLALAILTMVLVIPRTRAGKGVTGVGWIDDLVPVSVLSFLVIGVALVVRSVV